MSALSLGSLPYLAAIATGWALATASLVWLAGAPFHPTTPITLQETAK
ncbi:hypothetical protein SAMN06297129_3004 [Pseudooceanicola antarcticus]|uniref:Uncharacterized protein n=1 Tax=Pseudooceanicola antarcticus TaxID=1247613 RepID=A0A285J5D9_9RHOB|nr:hypothetical protein [Pseudooceanicola antarcticus]SNY55428.1 hypothetical protein SAMN06297129_3004 [Pseudooceanicola antarcticus]